jgi:alpha-beta hydrolase superfamily lysophospholipase
MADESGCILATHTASDGYRWQYRHYPPVPTASARGRVVFLHGIQSHGGWYEQSCRHLAGAGLSVYFLDRRGAGLNQQDRGDTPSFRRLIDDVAEFLRSLREQQAAGKVLLAAISWGGKVATALQRRHPGLVDGLALICPGFFPCVRLSPWQKLRVLAARLLRPRRLFPVPLDEPELFTATPRWLQFLRDDLLSLHRATARFLAESVRLDIYLRWTPRHVRLPVLLFLAGQDRIIDNAPTRAFVERFASGDRQLIEYPQAHHTLEFEPDPTPYFTELSRWLLAHTD